MTKRRTTFLLAVLCSTYAVATPHSDQARHKDGTSQDSSVNSQVNPQGIETKPVAVKLMNTGKSDAEAAQDAAHVNYEEHTESWVVWLTVVAVVVGLFQLAVFIFQAIFMRNTVAEMRKANKSTEDALLASDRPWVGIEAINVQPFRVGVPIKVIMISRNSGKSPALQHRSNMDGLVRAANQEAPSIPTEKGGMDTAAVLMPSANFEIAPFIDAAPLTQEQLTRIEDGTDKVWIVGRLDYQDSRGHSHETTFRAFYNPKTKGFGAGSTGNHIT